MRIKNVFLGLILKCHWMYVNCIMDSLEEHDGLRNSNDWENNNCQPGYIPHSDMYEDISSASDKQNEDGNNSQLDEDVMELSDTDINVVSVIKYASRLQDDTANKAVGNYTESIGAVTGTNAIAGDAIVISDSVASDTENNGNEENMVRRKVAKNAAINGAVMDNSTTMQGSSKASKDKSYMIASPITDPDRIVPLFITSASHPFLSPEHIIAPWKGVKAADINLSSSEEIVGDLGLTEIALISLYTEQDIQKHLISSANMIRKKLRDTKSLRKECQDNVDLLFNNPKILFFLLMEDRTFYRMFYSFVNELRAYLSEIAGKEISQTQMIWIFSLLDDKNSPQQEKWLVNLVSTISNNMEILRYFSMAKQPLKDYCWAKYFGEDKSCWLKSNIQPSTKYQNRIPGAITNANCVYNVLLYTLYYERSFHLTIYGHSLMDNGSWYNNIKQIDMDLHATITNIYRRNPIQIVSPEVWKRLQAAENKRAKSVEYSKLQWFVVKHIKDLFEGFGKVWICQLADTFKLALPTQESPTALGKRPYNTMANNNAPSNQNSNQQSNKQTRLE
ncbi:hypothetical protein NEHOM01_0366 [Nematocida homosporus]|uniref:uncharacterized protein n=1 Tax=Nematocida homosporus TaxID=1912981 RepID=UPI00221EE54B|nr:uncharacterized protein NEHOM01_0366 [Nematocida homosporus]KAI5184764.1 hypothetical protein NEHOM01_0366 [Nematocida homosporus]